MKHLKILPIYILAIMLYGCTSVQQQQCPPGTLDMPECPPADAVEDEVINEIYNSLLFSHTGNRRIRPYEASDEFDEGKYEDRYIYHSNRAQSSLATIKAFSEIKKRLEDMPS